jgi:hypothetical protein
MIVDLFLVYSFIRRLATPFKEWKAYELGIIDENGNQLRKRKDFRTVKEREAFGLFDIVILKLKRLLEKIPGGSSRIGTYAAALWLIKEQKIIESGKYLSKEEIKEGLLDSISEVKSKSNKDFLFECFFEDAPVTSVASGEIQGIGYGPKGEPGLTSDQMKIYKKKNKPLKRFQDILK